MIRFELTPEQEKKVRKFHPKCRKIYTGAIGGGEEYRFGPNGLGYTVVYVCKCGKELDLTESENW